MSSTRSTRPARKSDRPCGTEKRATGGRSLERSSRPTRASTSPTYRRPSVARRRRSSPSSIPGRLSPAWRSTSTVTSPLRDGPANIRPGYFSGRLVSVENHHPVIGPLPSLTLPFAAVEGLSGSPVMTCSNGPKAVRANIARLAGARLVTSLEVEEGKRLAEGLIKRRCLPRSDRRGNRASGARCAHEKALSPADGLFLGGTIACIGAPFAARRSQVATASKPADRLRTLRPNAQARGAPLRSRVPYAQSRSITTSWPKAALHLQARPSGRLLRRQAVAPEETPAIPADRSRRPQRQSGTTAPLLPIRSRIGARSAR